MFILFCNLRKNKRKRKGRGGRKQNGEGKRKCGKKGTLSGMVELIKLEMTI